MSKKYYEGRSVSKFEVIYFTLNFCRQLIFVSLFQYYVPTFMSLISICRYFYVAIFMSLFFCRYFYAAKLLESMRNFVVATLLSTKRVCACPMPRGWVGVCQNSNPLLIFARLRPTRKYKVTILNSSSREKRPITRQLHKFEGRFRL